MLPIQDMMEDNQMIDEAERSNRYFNKYFLWCCMCDMLKWFHICHSLQHLFSERKRGAINFHYIMPAVIIITLQAIDQPC